MTQSAQQHGEATACLHNGEVTFANKLECEYARRRCRTPYVPKAKKGFPLPLSKLIVVNVEDMETDCRKLLKRAVKRSKRQ